MRSLLAASLLISVAVILAVSSHDVTGQDEDNHFVISGTVTNRSGVPQGGTTVTAVEALICKGLGDTCNDDADCCSIPGSSPDSPDRNVECSADGSGVKRCAETSCEALGNVCNNDCCFVPGSKVLCSLNDDICEASLCAGLGQECANTNDCCIIPGRAVSCSDNTCAYANDAGIRTTNTTNDQGKYLLQVKAYAAYDVSVSGAGYEHLTTPNVWVLKNTELNFTLLRPLEDDCNNDCTKSDGLCHQSCHGKGTCQFYENLGDGVKFPVEVTKELCDFSVPGIVDVTEADINRLNQGFPNLADTLGSGTYFDDNYLGKQVNCCTGTPVHVKKVQISVCDDNYITIARSVLLNGRRVNMVIAMFNTKSEGCSNAEPE